jgi:D-glycero-D-manno-heptose 1,7-bisphosphate phosphatase
MLEPNARLESMRVRPAAFLDRDGTLNEAVPDPESGMPESPLRVQDVRVLPDAAAAARELAAAGYALVCVSNQPAAAKGKASVEQLLSVHERVIALLGQEGVEIEASLLCPHYPGAAVGDLDVQCSCRKPAPGMLLDAAASFKLDLGSSWMLGDTDTDIAAGKAAGCRTALIEYRPSAHKRLGQARPDVLAAGICGAVAQLRDHLPR